MYTSDSNFFRLAKIFISLVILFSPGQADAQSVQTDITMDASPAFEGNFKYGEWLPVWITLENRGPDFEGQIRIDVSQSGGNVTFARNVSLPNGSRKLISLSVLPNNFSRELEIQLISDQEVVLSSLIPVFPAQNDSIFIGISSEERGALSLIGNIELEDSFRKITLFNLLTSQVPTTSREMESVDVIILNNSDTSNLTDQQKSSLEGWIDNGGHLIIGGGSGIEKTISGLPGEVVNFSIGPTTQIHNLNSLEVFADNQEILVSGPFSITNVQTKTGKPLLTEETISLFHQWNYGKGFISLLSLDLSASPFNAWGGTTRFWEKILAPDSNFPQWMPRDMSLRQMRANSMAYPLSNLPALDIPSVKALAILLSIYIITIGPINYLILKRKKTLHLAWVTIPLLTLLFTGGAFGLAYTLRGNDIMINKLAIIDLRHNGNAAIDTYVGVFSPSQSAYEIQIEGNQLLSPSFGGYYDPWSSSGFYSLGQTTFLQGNPSSVLGLSVDQWSMQSFNVEGIQTNLGKIDSDLVFSGETLSGTLVSELPFTLMDAVLVVGRDTFLLGDLVQYDEVHIDFPLKVKNVNIYDNQLTYQIINTAYPNADFSYQRDTETKRAILDNYFQPYGYWLGPNFESTMKTESDQINFSNIFLIGWTTETPPKIQLNGNQVSQNTLGLVTAQIPIRIGTGSFTIPSTFFDGKIIEQPSSSGYCGSLATHIYMDYGTAKFEFTIPEPILESKITEISLFFEEDISQWAQEDPGFLLWVYNWKNSVWMQIPGLQKGTNPLVDAEQYIGPDGSIQVQIDKENRNSGGCLLVAMGLKGINQ